MASLAVDDRQRWRRLRAQAFRSDPVRRQHDAALDVVDDLFRILRARVVGGHDHHVAEPGRDRAHQGPLGFVPVAAAAEHRDDAALRQRARRLEQVLQRIVGMGVVNDDANVVVGRRDHLETSGDVLEVADALFDGTEGQIESGGGRHGRRGCCRRWDGRPAASGSAPCRAASSRRTTRPSSE